MVYYFIFNGPFNSGVGGHFNSLLSTARAVGRYQEVEVVVLGERDTSLFREAGLRSSFVRVNALTQGRALLELYRRVGASDRVGALHAFDPHAYFFVRILSALLDVPTCYTKCGGPSVRYIPKARSLVLYSGEDWDYYRNRRAYARCGFHHIPNRVPLPHRNEVRLEAIRGDVDFDGVKLLRITRIGHYYRKTLEDSIELLREMRGAGIAARLFVVGKVADHEVYEAFAETEGVVFLTEERHYQLASELIPLFDIVIGTGRSAMEGLAHGKPVLAPVRNARIPRLVNDRTIAAFRHYNFSERAVLDEADAGTRDDYHALVSDLEAHGERGRAYFREHFWVDRAVDRYLETVYARQRKVYFPIDLVLHFISIQSKFVLDALRILLGKRQARVKRFVDRALATRPAGV